MSKQNKLKQQIQERARAEAEALKARAAEDEVRDELRAWFVREYGLERAGELWDGFWKVRCHHLWEEHYRINFWCRLCTGVVPTAKISYSFFVKYTKVRGFYDSDPNMERSFAQK